MADERLTVVTGAGGFIGGHLCRLLASRQERFVGVLSARDAQTVPDATAWPAGSFRALDLRDRRAVRALLTELSPSRIFNLAAVGTHPHGPVDTTAYVEVNVALPAALLEFAPAGCILVQVGSMAQYKGSAAPLHEDFAERDSSTLYSWSKNAADSLLETIERSGQTDSSVIRIRLFGVVGADEPPHRLLPSLVRGCLESTDIALSDGTQVRDLLHVDDAVAAMAHLSEEPSVLGRAVNVARGQGRSIRWIAERAAERLSCQAKLRFGAIPRRAYETQQELVADVSRLGSTGWRPRWSIEETIDRTISEMMPVRA